MAVRLTSKDHRERAAAELLNILAEYPGGVRTSDLRGTPMFHGTRTLSNSQIIRLLRESGKVEQHNGGQGARTFSFWRLK
jgi:hypothetical protein